MSEHKTSGKKIYLYKKLKIIIGNKKANQNQNENNMNQIEPVMPYLEQTIYEVLQKGLIELDKNRPDDPLEFLGKYLISAANHN